MRLLTGKMIGQSGQELFIAVFFSFIIHVIFLFAAIFFYMRTTPKISVPPFYDVALVAQPTDLPTVPSQAPPEKKQETTLKGHKAPAASKQGAMPGLKEQKSAREEPDEREGKAPRATAPAGQPVAVTVALGQEFKFPWYLTIIRDKIERHWNPPPGAREMKAKVTFSVLRSGQVAGNPRLEVASGNFYFDQAAMRAISTSSPFPPLPEEFFKESIEVSVDLMPEE
ncbi:MAG TPA: TonB family protein [Nitrospirota bacterium]|nr:TonB family protein [Nitrospirota bacterium]